MNFVDDSFGDFLYDVDNSTQNTMKPRRRRTTFSECVTVMLRETEGDIEYCDVEWVGWLVGWLVGLVWIADLMGYGWLVACLVDFLR